MTLARSGYLPATVATLGLALSGSFASAAVPADTSALRAAVTLDGVQAHQEALQDIADGNGGTRASGTPGFDESVDYVVETLQAAGYAPVRQDFDFAFFQELSPPVLVGDGIVYTPDVDFFTMTYSGSGSVTAGDTVQPDNFGCEAGDFAGAVFTGQIALILRGVCNFSVKAALAEDAGALGVIIYNDEARQDPFLGTLGSPDFTVPVVGTSFTIGQQLADTTVHLETSTVSELRPAANVIAETAGGRDDRVVVVGAHLDSVPEGPGIQDNGSGSAAILEIAVQMAELGIEPRNKVRFAWWGAEEFGLLGSQYYVDNLTKREQKDIALNLNFDMIGSPNFVRFIYDGDGSATGPKGPTGSKNIEQVFLEFFDGEDLPTEPTAFDGRSDYGPFIAVGIPAGGLFTGAEEIKTPEEVEIYGGTAGDQYDPCYHLACDTFDNISLEALDQMSDAAAHSVLIFAQTTSAVSGTAKGEARGKVALETLEFRGGHRQR
jgi:Zn-dependent M28 family amino/carboxypeptidase